MHSARGLLANKGRERGTPTIERFLTKIEAVPLGGCWVWLDKLSKAGYGRIYDSMSGRKLFAHRFSYSFFCGEVPEDAFVCHRCDNPECVNPHHLFVGSPLDNVRDMDSKGRRRNSLGVNNKSSKLSERDVLRIREDARTQVAIAKEYGVHQTIISDIKRRKSWAHV